DGDGAQEVVAASANITAIRGDGSTMWSVPAGGEPVLRGVSAADLDGDGGVDLAFVTGDGRFGVVRGRDGARLYDFDAATVHHRERAHSAHGPLLADLDGDGRLDAFFVVGGGNRDRHGSAFCLTGFAGTGPGWFMFRHDARNTGNAATPLDPVLLAHIPAHAARPSTSSPRRRPPAPGVPPARDPSPTDVQRALAGQRGVSTEALDAALRAHATTLRGGARTDDVLMTLARGEPLPNSASWAVLEGLGYSDTEDTRLYLLGRLDREEDAGLYMAAALGLARLRESRAADRIGRRVLEFRELWSGVEPYLLGALEATGGKAAAPHFAAYLLDPRARDEGRLVHVLGVLERLDDAKARETARAMLEAEDASRLTPRVRERIQDLLDA
ncbi:MAG: FG-GAP repeat domain-containing protein, partial [Planctomycetota bacterium]